MQFGTISGIRFKAVSATQPFDAFRLCSVTCEIARGAESSVVGYIYECNVIFKIRF